MKVRFRNKLESFVRCEEQVWRDCGGPSNTFLPPHAALERHPNLFLLAFGLNSDNSPLLKKVIQFHDVRWVRESKELGREAVSGRVASKVSTPHAPKVRTGV